MHPPRQVYIELISSLACFEPDMVQAMGDEVTVYDALVDNIIPPTSYSLPADRCDVRQDVMKEHYERVMTDSSEFWNKNKDKLPKLYMLCHYLVTFPPSCAAVERLSSILQRSFGEKQTDSLDDYMSLSVMYQYNGR